MTAKEMTCELCKGRKFTTTDRVAMRDHARTAHRKTAKEISRALGKI